MTHRPDDAWRLRSHRLEARVTHGATDWYRIRAEGTGARIDIFDEIGWFGVSAADFVRDLRRLDVDAIDLHLNSPGGDVFDGIAIYNAVRDHRATVTATVDGLAASIASVILQAADVRVMNRSTQVMIHEAHALAIGPAAVMREMADRLDEASDAIADIYADRSGQGDRESWRAAMRAGEGNFGTRYGPDAAVEAGLADRAAGEGDGEGAAAKFDLRVFSLASPAPAPDPAAIPAGDGAGTVERDLAAVAAAFSLEGT